MDTTTTSGTFVQTTPGPGPSWHCLDDAGAAYCGASLVNGEWWTTDQMWLGKVCEACQRVALRVPATISADLGDRIVASALVNHDTVADLVLLAAELARDTHRTVDLAALRVDLRSDGYVFDRDGWMVVR